MRQRQRKRRSILYSGNRSWSDPRPILIACISNNLLQFRAVDKDTFRRKRERLGLTQEELAKRMDINRITIIRYESGESPIPKAVEMALKVIEAEEKA
jgi:DNA-binding XRE family transcriptional regulator